MKKKKEVLLQKKRIEQKHELFIAVCNIHKNLFLESIAFTNNAELLESKHSDELTEICKQLDYWNKKKRLYLSELDEMRDILEDLEKKIKQ